MRIETSAKTWNILTMVALGVLVLIAGYDLIVPKPADKMTASSRQRELNRLTASLQTQQKEIDAMKADVNKYVWSAPAEKIQTQSLNTLTSITANHKVTLLGFRPQKVSQENGLNHIPYLILLDGPYPNVVAVLRELEVPQNKLAVDTVQVASSDASSDRVNASIGVIAYTPIAQETANVTSIKKQK